MIELISSKQSLIDLRKSILTSVGIVPTMGNLHEGHLELLKAALRETENVFITIFVNPKQFGPKEDFAKYPRTLEADIEKIKKTSHDFPNKKVVIFTPDSPDEVFDKNQISINITPFDTILEGAIRPGHFNGVATVVYQLFSLIRPQKAYFGLKDFQQVVVIKEMVKNLALPIEVIPIEIIRDSHGLALSSRNQYLSEPEKERALILIQTLKKISSILNNSLQNTPKAIEFINETLRDSGWNYLEIRDCETLSNDLTYSKRIVLLGVYQINATRLLDNLIVTLK
jgi:pantoate--beta-alanine ligase